MPLVKYQDEYNVRYEVNYEYKSSPSGEILDITTTIYDPRVYGEIAKGYISRHKTYIKGLISITRQVIRPEEDGYILVAEGGTQKVTESLNEYIQIDGLFIKDPFKFRLNHDLVAEESGIVDNGPALVDIYDTFNSCIWADLDLYGNIMPSSENVLDFIDVY